MTFKVSRSIIKKVARLITKQKRFKRRLCLKSNLLLMKKEKSNKMNLKSLYKTKKPLVTYYLHHLYMITY